MRMNTEREKSSSMNLKKFLKMKIRQVVTNKPAYMSTHPTGRHLFHCATVYYEQKLNQSTVHSIHRLDRETSGVLLLAKNPTTANQLTVEFENNNVKKCYFFIAEKISCR